LTLGIRWAQ